MTTTPRPCTLLESLTAQLGTPWRMEHTGGGLMVIEHYTPTGTTVVSEDGPDLLVGYYPGQAWYQGEYESATMHTIEGATALPVADLVATIQGFTPASNTGHTLAVQWEGQPEGCTRSLTLIAQEDGTIHATVELTDFVSAYVELPAQDLALLAAKAVVCAEAREQHIMNNDGATLTWTDAEIIAYFRANMTPEQVDGFDVFGLSLMLVLSTDK